MFEYGILKGIINSGTVCAQQSQLVANIHQELEDLVRRPVGDTLPLKHRSTHSACLQPHAIYDERANENVFPGVSAYQFIKVVLSGLTKTPTLNDLITEVGN